MQSYLVASDSLNSSWAFCMLMNSWNGTPSAKGSMVAIFGEALFKYR